MARTRSHSWNGRAIPVARIAVSLTVLAGFLGSASTASATATYEYTSVLFNAFLSDQTPPVGSFTSAMRITGSITLAAPLAANTATTDITAQVLSWSYSDGRGTVTSSDPGSGIVFEIGTAGGAINRWRTVARNPFPTALGERQTTITTLWDGASRGDISTIFECAEVSTSGSCNLFNQDKAAANTTFGSWTLVPEPGTALLVAAGLVGIAAGRRRR